MNKYYTAPRATVVEIDNEAIMVNSDELRVSLWDGEIKKDIAVSGEDTKGYGEDAGSRQSDNYRSTLWGE